MAKSKNYSMMSSPAVTGRGSIMDSPPTAAGNDVMVLFLRGLIRVYQLQSPLWGARCRFYPSCSEYTREALAQAGFWKGLSLSGKRILKCHPWNPGGVDWVEVSNGK